MSVPTDRDSGGPRGPREPVPPSDGPLFRVLLALVGAGLGVVLALVILAKVWPEISDLASTAITASAGLVGAALGVLTFRRS